MKRSSQVALLLMGTVAVGGGAYALMPSENCQPGVVQPDGRLSQASQNCNRGSGSSSGGGSRRLSLVVVELILQFIAALRERRQDEPRLLDRWRP